MKKSNSILYILLSLAVLLLGSCHVERVKGNGNIVSREIAVSDYQQILVLGNGIEANYTQSDEGPYLKIECDQNILDLLRIESNDQVLLIRPQNKNMTISPSRFTITARSSKLRKIKMGGSVDFVVHDSLLCGKLYIDMAGKNSIRIDSLSAEQLDCQSAGEGLVKLKGTATHTKFHSIGKNTFGALDLRTDHFDARTIGKTDMEITVLKRITTKNVGKMKVAFQTEGHAISRNFNSIGSAFYNTLPSKNSGL